MLKPQPNQQRYLDVLRAMTPSERLRKACELTEQSRALFKAGLRRQFPELGARELHALYLEKLQACHNSRS